MNALPRSNNLVDNINKVEQSVTAPGHFDDPRDSFRDEIWENMGSIFHYARAVRSHLEIPNDALAAASLIFLRGCLEAAERANEKLLRANGFEMSAAPQKCEGSDGAT